MSHDFAFFYFILHFLALKVPINIIKLKRNKTGEPCFHGSHVFSIASRNKTKTTLILKLAEFNVVALKKELQISCVSKHKTSKNLSI